MRDRLQVIGDAAIRLTAGEGEYLYRSLLSTLPALDRDFMNESAQLELANDAVSSTCISAVDVGLVVTLDSKVEVVEAEVVTLLLDEGWEDVGLEDANMEARRSLATII